MLFLCVCVSLSLRKEEKGLVGSHLGKDVLWQVGGE